MIYLKRFITLCKAGNDVTVVSKGAWGDVLQKNGLHRALTADGQSLMLRAFCDSGYKLTFEDDMEGWLHCHAAFILPFVYLSYHYGCDLRKADRNDIVSMMKAAEEAYSLIEACGIKIRPKDDAVYFRSKPKLAVQKIHGS